MNEVGRPIHFPIDKLRDVLNGYINADEVEIALWLMDKLPSFYMQHKPDWLEPMRERLHKQLWTPVQYREIYDQPIDEPMLIKHWPLRGKVIEAIVRDYNEKGITPNICEIAPGAAFVPLGLKLKGHKFTYEYASLDKIPGEYDKPQDPKVSILVAFEIIEHLWQPMEIKQNALKFSREFSVIAISTPYNCYNGGMNNWENRELGHLRCYNPDSFHKTIDRMFPGRTWELFTDDTLVAIGR